MQPCTGPRRRQPARGRIRAREKPGRHSLEGGKGRQAYLRSYSTTEEGLGIYREGAICSQKQEISYPTSPSKVTSGSVPTGPMFAQTVPSTMHNSGHSPVPIGLGPQARETSGRSRRGGIRSTRRFPELIVLPGRRRTHSVDARFFTAGEPRTFAIMADAGLAATSGGGGGRPREAKSAQK